MGAALRGSSTAPLGDRTVRGERGRRDGARGRSAAPAWRQQMRRAAAIGPSAFRPFGPSARHPPRLRLWGRPRSAAARGRGGRPKESRFAPKVPRIAPKAALCTKSSALSPKGPGLPAESADLRQKRLNWTQNSPNLLRNSTRSPKRDSICPQRASNGSEKAPNCPKRPQAALRAIRCLKRDPICPKRALNCPEEP